MIGMNAASGRAISGVDHLRQSMADILNTPIGSRVMRRTYGSMIPDLIDQPLTGPNILRIYAATAFALMNWEPRVRISGMSLDITIDGQAHLIIDCIANGSDLQIKVPLKS